MAHALIDGDAKRCSKCKETKSRTEFHKSKVERDGLAHWCKVCANANTRRYHANNKHDPEYKAKRKGRWTQMCFGITEVEYEDKLKQQPYCGICQTPFGAFDSPPHLDHNHSTGALREFLCSNCNRGLGHFKEDVQILLNALAYLEKHK